MEYAFALGLGLIIGSFLNVCIHRLPREESIAWPGSKCPNCGVHIKWRDNVPVISFILLRAKCRACGGPIAWRYPLVECLTGLAAVLLFYKHGATPVWFAVSLLAACGIIVLSFVDMDFMIIPDEISLGLLALGLLSFWANPNFTGGWLRELGQSFGGAAAGFFSLWAVAEIGERIFKKEAMGGGDIKLMAGLGALLGWQGVFSTLMLGSFFGAAYGVALIISKKAGKSDPIPFGPFLGLGGLINLYRLIPLSAFILG